MLHQFCNNSVRPQLKHAHASASGAGADGVADDASLVRNGLMCTGEVYHASCGGENFRTLCSTCGQESDEQWKPWSEWETCKSEVREANVPSAPHRTYMHDGWQGYGHWLGTGKVGVKKYQQFLPFKEALLHARSLKLKTVTEWRA